MDAALAALRKRCRQPWPIAPPNALLTSTTDSELVLWRCDRQACTKAMDVPTGPSMAVSVRLGASDQPVALTRLGPLMLLWRGSAEPRSLLLAADPAGPSPHRLRSLVDWDGVLHAVVSTDDQLRRVPLPQSAARK